MSSPGYHGLMNILPGGSWINFQLRIIVTNNDRSFYPDSKIEIPCENCEMYLTLGVQVECFVKIGFCE